MESSKTIPGQYQTWDYYVADGIVPILETPNDNNQAASIAAFIQVGTVPQLPEYGVPWVEFFTGQVNFGALDGAIKANLGNIGKVSYYPSYDLINGNLVATVVNQ